MKLFLGFLFLLLDVEITVWKGVLDLLPDFVGYILVIQRLQEREDPWRHLAFGLTLASVVLFVGDLMNLTARVAIGFGLAAIVAEVLMLVLLFHVIGKNSRLRQLFPVLACIRLLCLMVSWIPLIGGICATANGVMALCYLAAAYQPLTKIYP